MKKAFLVWQAILAGLVVTAGGTAAIGDIIPEKYLGLFVLVVGGLQAATATYAHGLTQPSPAEVAAAERIQRADADAKHVGLQIGAGDAYWAPVGTEPDGPGWRHLGRIEA